MLLTTAHVIKSFRLMLVQGHIQMYTNFDSWTTVILRKVQVCTGPMAGACLVQKSITKTQTLFSTNQQSIISVLAQPLVHSNCSYIITYQMYKMKSWLPILYVC